MDPEHLLQQVLLLLILVLIYQPLKTLLSSQYPIGTVVSTGFKGANGYCIIIKNDNLEITYAHISPNYIINKGQLVESGQLIGYVGPKYLSANIGNPNYTDSQGNFTNGATTGPHLHLTIKKDGIAVNPLSYFNKD